jgi:hypothetical protein
MAPQLHYLHPQAMRQHENARDVNSDSDQWHSSLVYQDNPATRNLPPPFLTASSGTEHHWLDTTIQRSSIERMATISKQTPLMAWDQDNHAYRKIMVYCYDCNHLEGVF